MPENLRETLRKRTLLLDGAFGTYLDIKAPSAVQDSPARGCMEILSLSSPDLVASIHADYLEAGADAVETNTFGANFLKLSEYGLSKDVYEINLAATELARKEADRFSSEMWPRYVIGTMGPTGKLPSSPDPDLGNITYGELKDIFFNQAKGIIDGGADAILVETGQDMLEMKAAVNGAKLAMFERKKDLVLMAHATLGNNGRMLLGTEVSAFMAVMCGLGVEVVGLNCGTGPLEMEDPIKFLTANAPCSVSCVPNAGLPFEENGKTVFPLSPEEMSGIIADLCVRYRLDAVGGCCGTNPAHIKAIREKLPLIQKRVASAKVYAASSYKGFDMSSKTRPIKVGERMNTQGSRKMKSMLEARDYDGILELGKKQESQGADVLDLCVAMTERSTEIKDAEILTKRLSESVEIPLMIDSTDVEVIEKALECYPGTAFINSVNMEDGGHKAEKVFAMAKEHGAFIVCLAIDENGMAVSPDKKIEVAGRIYSLAVEKYSIHPGRLIFDVLTFTLATGEEEYKNSARETIEAIKTLKETYPGVLAVLGVSNVSFGFLGPSRKVLNMVFLGMAVSAGLDMAIVNGAEYVPWTDLKENERLLAEKLILNEGPGALTAFVEYFFDRTRQDTVKTEEIKQNALTIEEKILKCVLDRDGTGILPLVDEALKTYTPDAVISDILMRAMKIAGDRLDKGEMVLPYVLQAAEVMKKAIEYLEKDLPSGNVNSRGKVILATVEGDVHDIGKNLVKMLLVNNGFSVIDLGKQVPVKRIIEELAKEKPDAVGLSALLVSTSRHMRTCVMSMHESGLDYPLIVGGAPVNEAFAMDIAHIGGTDLYRGGVFYAKDAFTGLKIMKALVEKEEKKKMLKEYRLKASGNAPLEKVADKPAKKRVINKNPSTVPVPPFYGVRAIDRMASDEVLEYLDKTFLFEVSWGASLKDPDEKKKLIKQEYEDVLNDIKNESIKKNWLDLKAVYGYFNCSVVPGKIWVLDTLGKELAAFDFKPGDNGPGIDGYFNSTDLAAFQAVTIGGKITKVIGELIDRGENTKAFYLHGFAVNLAEAAAAYLHDSIRKELGLKPDQGKRYSPGYPLWKDLKDQEKIFKLLDVTNRIGVTLTADHQMVPEQSTTAIIVHNDRAVY